MYSSTNRKCVSETRVGGIGSGRDFISGCFRNNAGGGGYRSRYTYFSNLVAKTKVSFSKFGCVASFGGTSSKQFAKSQFAKVLSHESFPLCGTAMYVGLTTRWGECLDMKLHVSWRHH